MSLVPSTEVFSLRSVGSTVVWCATNTIWPRSVTYIYVPPMSWCGVQEEAAGVEIGAGEEVYVEHNGKIVAGRVTEVTSHTQYEVAFEDGSVCSNLTAGDLVVC